MSLSENAGMNLGTGMGAASSRGENFRDTAAAEDMRNNALNDRTVDNAMSSSAFDDSQRDRSVDRALAGGTESDMLRNRDQSFTTDNDMVNDAAAMPATQSFTSDMNDEATRDRTLAQEASANLSDRMGNGASNGATRHDTTEHLAGRDMAEGTRIPVIQEDVEIGKREVQRGGVRVFQRVREQPVNESVDLREEHVNVERHPVDKPATEADLAAFKEGSIELREMAEEPVVSKTARVVEEVVLNKEATQRTQEVNDSVRRTDVEVEQLGAGSGTSRMTGDLTGSMAATDSVGMTGMAGDDDADYRRHWQSAYGDSGGRYEDYASAYRYGSTMAGTERFKNYRWDEVEPDVRSDWESSHPESTWDKVKDAVRYGAEKVTGRHH
ncbi:YsnF/AvaK domain-containing protein [Noviherbaspirillum sp. 17J57-3]|uniref:YsnF/AvaK domain-containing protein n=2 Tax=Noviherbaspirillum galbum TaxID=2709383 RepID=A0A6B3SRT7_9BURK|nr:YsnF/AvaK domain-containing protein [Noviherbaspirillum galbum]